MYYVFYDSGNDVFFCRVANVFLKDLMGYLANNYQEFLQPGSTRTEASRINQFFEKNKLKINPLNCNMFHNCGNQQCRDNYKAVLDSCQVQRFSDQIFETKKNLSQNSNPAVSRQRLILQVILNKYATLTSKMVEEIKISSEKDPIGYKYDNLKRHKRLYAIKARRLIRKIMRMNADAEAFMYVRAPVGSHFNYFAQKIRRTITPCDSLQVV